MNTVNARISYLATLLFGYLLLVTPYQQFYSVFYILIPSSTISLFWLPTRKRLLLWPLHTSFLCVFFFLVCFEVFLLQQIIVHVIETSVSE